MDKLTKEETAEVLASLVEPCTCGHNRVDHQWWSQDCMGEGFCGCPKFKLKKSEEVLDKLIWTVLE